MGHGLRRRGARVVDAAGTALLPALHDHHLHLRSLAAQASSVCVGPPSVRGRDEFVAKLREAASRCAEGHWIRAIGYHESVAGELDRWALDNIVAEHPVRVQHCSGALWILNSTGLATSRLDTSYANGVQRAADGSATGRLWRLDGLGRQVFGATAANMFDVSRDLAAMGVASITDATPEQTNEGIADLVTLVKSGEIVQRLHLMAPVEVECDDDHVTVGPVKVVLDDLTLPELDELVETVAAAHRAGRGVAIHCVSTVQLVLAITAFDAAGASTLDRIEHGAVIPVELIPALRRLGITIVTQPNFVAERGDRYLRDVAPEDRDSLYRCRSLLEAGVRVAFGTDAPFGGHNPWAAMQAAVGRTTHRGEMLGASERISPLVALRLFLGSAENPSSPRRLAVGERADLCLLDVPLDAALRQLESVSVRATIIDGILRHVI
jgi:predicted amidohydrolase YtcJ